MTGKYNTTWVRRLYFNIVKGKFKWDKYQATQEYYGINIQTMPLYSDTQHRNLCGFTLSFPYQRYPNIDYDWDNNIFQVGGQQIEFDLVTKQIHWID